MSRFAGIGSTPPASAGTEAVATVVGIRRVEGSTASERARALLAELFGLFGLPSARQMSPEFSLHGPLGVSRMQQRVFGLIRTFRDDAEPLVAVPPRKMADFGAQREFAGRAGTGDDRARAFLYPQAGTLVERPEWNGRAGHDIAAVDVAAGVDRDVDRRLAALVPDAPARRFASARTRRCRTTRSARVRRWVGSPGRHRETHRDSRRR